MGTVVILSGVKRPERKYTSRLPRLKISVAIPLLPLRAFMARTGTLSLLEQFKNWANFAYPNNSGVFDPFLKSLKKYGKSELDIQV